MDAYLEIALLLFGCGVVLLIAEFFIPTGGIFVVVSLVGFVVAVAMIGYYGTTTEAVVAVLGLSIGLPIAFSAMFSAWKRLALKSGLDSEGESETYLNTPEVAELSQLQGRYGKSVTMMRPSGTVEIDGRRIDAMSEGMMIESGIPIKCVEVRGGRVIVRRVEQPSNLADMDIDLE